MSWLKRFIYYSTSGVFMLLLLALPVFFALTIVFSSPHTIQTALKQSGAYDQFVDLVLNNSAEEANDPQTEQLLNDPEIRNIAKQAFTAELLERSSNDFVQGMYDWLNGKTPEPQFTIDLTSAKTTLTEGLTTYAEERAAGLPACTAEQLQTLNLQSDLLNLPCLPPGVTPAEVGTQFSSQLLDDADFLDQPIITNQTLADQNNGQPITANTQNIPETYKTLQNMRWVLLGATIILGVLLILARRDRRAGLRHVAWALLGATAFLVIALLAYWYVFTKVGTSTATNEAQTIALDGARVILTKVNTAICWFAAVYAALGAGILLLLKYRFKVPEPAPSTNSDIASSRSEEAKPQPQKQQK